jgi:hypothetical protein
VVLTPILEFNRARSACKSAALSGMTKLRSGAIARGDVLLCCCVGCLAKWEPGKAFMVWNVRALDGRRTLSHLLNVTRWQTGQLGRPACQSSFLTSCWAVPRDINGFICIRST